MKEDKKMQVFKLVMEGYTAICAGMSLHLLRKYFKQKKRDEKHFDDVIEIFKI